MQFYSIAHRICHFSKTDYSKASNGEDEKFLTSLYCFILFKSLIKDKKNLELLNKIAHVGQNSSMCKKIPLVTQL